MWCGAVGMVAWDGDKGGDSNDGGTSADVWPSAGGSEKSQHVPGHISSFDIPDLEGGVSYTVKVTALIGNHEGNPVSIIVTTREHGARGQHTGGVGTSALIPAHIPHSGGGSRAPC